jgi:hypothetical protein
MDSVGQGGHEAHLLLHSYARRVNLYHLLFFFCLSVLILLLLIFTLLLLLALPVIVQSQRVSIL